MGFSNGTLLLLSIHTIIIVMSVVIECDQFFFFNPITDYGVDKYDIGTGFGHFAIATQDVRIYTPDQFANMLLCYYLNSSLKEKLLLNCRYIN